MLIIGERINTSRKNILQAVDRRDVKFIQEEAIAQVEAGADFLDINAGSRTESEAEDLSWLVKVIQEVLEVPLCLDSPNSSALEVSLKVCKSKTLINSITGEEKRAEEILPLVKKYNSQVVALTMDEKGIPDNVDRRLKIIEKILKKVAEFKIPKDALYVDPLVQPISTNSLHALLALESLRQIESFFPEVKTIIGLSNVSFGLPKRELINQVFLPLALASGLDAVILDPLDKRLRANLSAAKVLLGKDDYCQEYLSSYRKGRLNV